MDLYYLIKKENLKRIFIFSTFLLAVFPILTYAMRSIVLMFWCISAFLFYFFNPIKKKEGSLYNKDLISLIIVSLPFLLLTISLVYSSNYGKGFQKLIQMLSLFVIPFFFYLNRNEINYRLVKKVIWFFSFSVVVLVLYQILISLFNIDFFLRDLYKGEIIANNLQDYSEISIEKVNEIKIRRFRNYILHLVDTHFTYQGLWIAFVICFFIKEGFNQFNKSKVKAAILFLLVFILFAWLLAIAARMPIIAIVISALFTLFFYSNLKVSFLFLFFGLFVLSMSYFFLTPVKVRLDEIVHSKFDLPTSGNDIETYNSVNVRNGIYFCSYQVIKENFLLGVGLGDNQTSLNYCYNNRIKAKIYTWRDYNTHNQYFFFLITSGIFGFLSYLGSLFIEFRSSFVKKSPLFLYFVLLVTFISLTENILVRSDGVMFYSFFAGLFLFNNLKTKRIDNN